jgi:hypothetical protein
LIAVKKKSATIATLPLSVISVLAELSFSSSTCTCSMMTVPLVGSLGQCRRLLCECECRSVDRPTVKILACRRSSNTHRNLENWNLCVFSICLRHSVSFVCRCCKAASIGTMASLSLARRLPALSRRASNSSTVLLRQQFSALVAVEDEFPGYVI